MKAMGFIGVIQTGDIDKAIECARKQIAEGRHIIVARHEYKIWPEEQAEYEEYVLSDGIYGRPLSHDAIEYEVHADFVEYDEDGNYRGRQ